MSCWFSISFVSNDLIGYLHDDVILLPRPEYFRLLLLLFKPRQDYQIWYEIKNEKDSGCKSKMTPSCKWPIITWIRVGKKGNWESTQANNFHLSIILPCNIYPKNNLFLRDFYLTGDGGKEVQARGRKVSACGLLEIHAS